MEKKLIAHLNTALRRKYLLRMIAIYKGVARNAGLSEIVLNDYYKNIEDCRKAGVDVSNGFDNINCLELYHANLEYYLTQKFGSLLS